MTAGLRCLLGLFDGVTGARVETMAQFNRRFVEGVRSPGPYLVEVML